MPRTQPTLMTRNVAVKMAYLPAQKRYLLAVLWVCNIFTTTVR